MDDAASSDPPQALPDAGDAAMMDSMDDLFGEAADDLGLDAAPLPLPSAPLAPAVLSRIADLQRSGCCTKLAWSNTGSIAQIAEDGLSIAFRTSLRQQSGVYELSDASKMTVDASEGTHFVHVQFSGPGTEMAAVDDQGGVHVHSLTGAIGRMSPAMMDPGAKVYDRTDLDAVVGLHWLPLWPSEFKTPYITSASKSDDRWLTQMRTPEQNAPRIHHPAENKNALFYVTANCRLCLLYQNEINVWQSVSVDLEAWASSEDLLSHAAFGADGDRLVLATHDNARHMRIYSISINWNPSQHSKGNIHYITVAPALYIGHLSALESVAPQHANTARLSHLAVVPKPARHADDGPPSSATVCAIFSHTPMPLDPSQSYDVFSTIARWTIEISTPTLHESFTKLKQSGPIPVQAATTVLKRQQDIMTNKLVLGMECLCHNTMLAFTASDCTIEFRDRTSWEVLQNFGDTAQASNLSQCGFGYLPKEQAAHIAHNADRSALVMSKPDGTFGLKPIALLAGWQPLEDGITDNKSALEVGVICLARQYAILSASSASSDEALAVLPVDLNDTLRTLFVKQFICIMCRHADISMLDQQKQQRTVIGEPFLARGMSAQMVLGAKPDTKERTFAGRFAYCFLNLRLLGFAFASSLSREGANARPDLAPSLVGHLKWGLDFLQYMVESVVEVKRNASPEVSVKELCEQTASTTGNPIIQLLLCSFGRTLIRLQVSSLGQAIKLVGTSIPRARTLEDRNILTDAYNYAKSVPVHLPLVRDFVDSVDSAVRAAYTDTGSNAPRRYDNELAIITEGHVPDELVPALQTLFDSILPKLTESADMGKLYFWDTTWLGIDRIPTAEDPKRYDAIRKMPLKEGTKLRICRRCGARMEDIAADAVRQAPGWLYHLQRHCFCQTYWWLE